MSGAAGNVKGLSDFLVNFGQSISGSSKVPVPDTWPSGEDVNKKGQLRLTDRLAFLEAPTVGLSQLQVTVGEAVSESTLPECFEVISISDARRLVQRTLQTEKTTHARIVLVRDVDLLKPDVLPIRHSLNDSPKTMSAAILLEDSDPNEAMFMKLIDDVLAVKRCVVLLGCESRDHTPDYMRLQKIPTLEIKVEDSVSPEKMGGHDAIGIKTALAKNTFPTWRLQLSTGLLQAALEEMKAVLFGYRQPSARVLVLHGKTGSGKTLLPYLLELLECRLHVTHVTIADYLRPELGETERTMTNIFQKAIRLTDQACGALPVLLFDDAHVLFPAFSMRTSHLRLVGHTADLLQRYCTANSPGKLVVIFCTPDPGLVASALLPVNATKTFPLIYPPQREWLQTLADLDKDSLPEGINIRSLQECIQGQSQDPLPLSVGLASLDEYVISIVASVSSPSQSPSNKYD
eukprot:Clim_evm64s88 gene=Clim_evmTU64s88